jgi:hypothetical protein
MHVTSSFCNSDFTRRAQKEPRRIMRMGPVLGGVALGVLEDGVRKARTAPKPAARSGEGLYMQSSEWIFE